MCNESLEGLVNVRLILGSVVAGGGWRVKLLACVVCVCSYSAINKRRGYPWI